MAYIYYCILVAVWTTKKRYLLLSERSQSLLYKTRRFRSFQCMETGVTTPGDPLIRSCMAIT
jgi:hypothetical protein